MTGFIYFMFYKSQLIYIGQTSNLKQRLKSYTHVRIDFIRFIECEESKLRYYEQRLINYFKPKCNKQHNPNFRFKPAAKLPIRKPSVFQKRRYALKFETNKVKFLEVPRNSQSDWYIERQKFIKWMREQDKTP